MKLCLSFFLMFITCSGLTAGTVVADESQRLGIQQMALAMANNRVPSGFLNYPTNSRFEWMLKAQKWNLEVRSAITLDERNYYMEMRPLPLNETHFQATAWRMDQGAWLAAMVTTTAKTVGSAQSISFYRFQEGIVPTMRPVKAAEVLPDINGSDFFEAKPGSAPCLYTKSMIGYSLPRVGQTITAFLLDLEEMGQELFLGTDPSCYNRLKTDHIELDWDGRKFVKGRAVKVKPGIANE